jgi:hypothetical protein
MDNKIQKLKQAIQQVLPAVIKEINEERIPALESAWGRTFREELENENQVTVEIAKNYARPVNNTFYRHIRSVLPEFEEHTTDGSDYVLDGVLIEDKNSFSDGNGWVGNGFNKTPVHMLKKFRVDANGRIIEAFIAVVDLSKTESGWSDKTLNTNRSTIQFSNEDIPHIDIIVGSIRPAKKWAKPIMESVA